MTGTCWVRAEPNTRRTLQEPSREEHDCDDDDGNDDADERGILPGLVRHVFARGRSWHAGKYDRAEAIVSPGHVFRANFVPTESDASDGARSRGKSADVLQAAADRHFAWMMSEVWAL